MAYPDAVLWRGEHVLAHRRPHWRMLVVPALVPPVTAFLAAFLAAVATALPGESTRTAIRLALLVLAVAAVVWLALLPLVRWRCTHLVITDRRVLVREGVVTRESVDVPAVTITGVRTRRTALERALGAGTLVVATAGTDEPWEFAGLGDVEHLATLVEQVARDRGGLRWADERADGADGRDGDPDEDHAEDPDGRPDADLAAQLDDELDDELDGQLDDAWGAWARDEDEAPVRRGLRRSSRRPARRSRAARTSR